MTGQNDRQDESLTGQVGDQAGQCPLTGCYFQPCHVLDKETKQKIQEHNDLHSFIPMKMSRNEQNKVTN